MALNTVKEGNVVTRLADSTVLPKMVTVRQLLDHSHIDPADLPELVRTELEPMRGRIRPGMSVAITCGSRGVCNIAVITRAIVDFVKSCGGQPFVFPAMGSHGGATAEGQREILRGYGVTEETMDCPIRATMEVVQVGETEEGMPVFVDRYAYEADGIILCGRVKAHTAFRGPYESGILKMSVIGLGKQHGAEHVHQDGFSDLGRLLPMIARVVFDKTNILGAVAVAENAFDQTCIVEGLLKEEIFEKEPDILRRSKERLGRIFFDDIDVLVVDRLGKDISGDGMDPNISGRFVLPQYCSGGIDAEKVVVLDITDETHGNAQGIGLAEVTTRRLVNRMKLEMTYPTGVTNTFLHLMKIPMIMDNDREALQLALMCCPEAEDHEHMKLIRIPNTAHIGEIEISEGLLPLGYAAENSAYSCSSPTEKTWGV